MARQSHIDALEEHSERERLRAEIAEHRAGIDAIQKAEDAREDRLIASELELERGRERAAIESTYPWSGSLTEQSAWLEQYPDNAWTCEQVLEHAHPRFGPSLDHLQRLSESELARFKTEHADEYHKAMSDDRLGAQVNG